jgi:general secretion pathway protein J
MNRRTNAEAGFTLIEVMIGLLLMAMLMTLIANGVQMGTRSWTRAEGVTADMDDIQTVQGLLRRTIARATPAFASADLKDTTILFAGEPETLTLVAPQPATQGDGPSAVQRFVLDRIGGVQGLFLRWQMDAPTGLQGPARQDLVLDHVASLRFAYFGPAGPGQDAAWQDRWVDRGRLPDLVRVRIERSDRAGRVWPELIVATRVTTNATCLYDASSSICRRVR